MFKTQKINNIVVSLPPELKNVDTRTIKGANYLSENYCTVFLSAAKKSGKTVAIFNLLKNCTGKNTHVIFFVSTFYSDKTYEAMKIMLDNSNIQYTIFTDLKDEDGNHIELLVEQLKEEAKQRFVDEEEKKNKPKKRKKEPVFFYPSQSDDEEEVKIRKTKYQAPDYIIIFDDLSDRLKDRSIDVLIKKHRHYRTKIICGSQYYLDIGKGARANIDYLLLFKGVSEEKLKQIHHDKALPIKFDVFKEIYQQATSKPYSFLYIDRVNDEYRINFNEKIEL